MTTAQPGMRKKEMGFRTLNLVDLDLKAKML